jgi:hypothetical protein
MSGSIWQVDHPVAHLCHGDLQARVNVLTPQRGLEQLRIAGTPLPGSTQRVVFAPDQTGVSAQLNEVYVRGADLIAVYTQTKGQPFRASVYWRTVSTADDRMAHAAVDVMVSLETDLLESRPAVTIEATLLAREVLALDGRPVEPAVAFNLAPPCQGGANRPQGFLIRLTGVDQSLALLVRPEDACEVTAKWDTQGCVRVTHHLLCDPLEKGVILRARVRSVWGRGDVDLRAASAWYDTLVSEKLPLTS